MSHFDLLDDADVERLLRENDVVGADSNLWLRSLRLLFHDGKPLGTTVGLTIPIEAERRVLFATLACTAKGRLVFRHALPRSTKMQSDVPDHITVELPREEVHITGYDESGKPTRT